MEIFDLTKQAMQAVDRDKESIWSVLNIQPQATQCTCVIFQLQLYLLQSDK